MYRTLPEGVRLSGNMRCIYIIGINTQQPLSHIALKQRAVYCIFAKVEKFRATVYL